MGITLHYYTGRTLSFTFFLKTNVNTDRFILITHIRLSIPEFARAPFTTAPQNTWHFNAEK